MGGVYLGLSGRRTYRRTRRWRGGALIVGWAWAGVVRHWVWDLQRHVSTSVHASLCVPFEAGSILSELAYKRGENFDNGEVC